MKRGAYDTGIGILMRSCGLNVEQLHEDLRRHDIRMDITKLRRHLRIGGAPLIIWLRLEKIFRYVDNIDGNHPIDDDDMPEAARIHRYVVEQVRANKMDPTVPWIDARTGKMDTPTPA